MTLPAETDLQAAMEAMAVPNIAVAYRRIADGDEMALLSEEAIGFEGRLRNRIAALANKTSIACSRVMRPTPSEARRPGPKLPKASLVHFSRRWLTSIPSQPG